MFRRKPKFAVVRSVGVAFLRRASFAPVLREIAVGEELAYDWATTDDAVYAIECRCGSAACRRIITGKDWHQRDLQRKYHGLFSWYLEQKIEFGGLGTEYGDP